MKNAIQECLIMVGLMRGKLSDETLTLAVEGTDISTDALLDEMESRYTLTAQRSHPMAGRVWIVEITSSLN